MPTRVIQALALALALILATSAGALLPRLLRIAESATLRYTDIAVEGAPPIVQIGTAIGALRGIIVDYLWLKVNARKEKGLFYELMADSELITKLQPRFAEVWGFLGHNMAYNVSVMTNTPEERWEWVNAGIRLVREQGLRYNPNDVVLHKELAFWFAHKIDGVSDDAHFYYKRQFADEWHLLLGPPPPSHAARVAWIKEIADAADTLDEAIDGRPALVAPVELVGKLADDLRIAAERVAEREKGRRMTGREVEALLRPTIEASDASTAVQNELRRILLTSDDAPSAVANLRRVEAAGGELIPALPPNPKVRELVDRLTKDLEPFGARFAFRPDREFVSNYGRWAAVAASNYAKLLGLEQRFMANDPVFKVFQELGADPQFAGAWKTLMAHLRRRALLDQYNMDPRLMYEYTRDLGPLDWRHPQSHALFWSRRGGQFGTKRYENEDEVYKLLNNDRLQIQAMQALARSGLMSVDPFSNDNPGRLNDIRWIGVIDRYFRVLYDRYYGTRGTGSDTFTNFHENFMKQAVRELYRAGDREGAQAILDELDKLYGSSGLVPNGFYRRPLEVVVQEVTYGEYEYQPEVARSDVYSALQRGFREGVLLRRPEVLQEAMKFAAQVTRYFKTTKYTDFVNKMGESRLGALIGTLDSSVRDVLEAVLVDRSSPLLERLFIYNGIDEAQKRLVYDRVKPAIEAEFNADQVASALQFAQAFPEPPGMEAYRAELAAEAARREKGDQSKSEMERK
ncbi:MAG: hypothetical protein U0575_12675 [Phycisphaerales bacterium]